jgi:hypothetical protein
MVAGATDHAVIVNTYCCSNVRQCHWIFRYRTGTAARALLGANRKPTSKALFGIGVHIGLVASWPPAVVVVETSERALVHPLVRQIERPRRQSIGQ